MGGMAGEEEGGLTENEVTIEVITYLRRLGWYCHRNHVGVFYTRDGRPQKINPPGMPDWLLLHPLHGIVWLELKRPGEKPRKVQLEYMAILKHKGFRVCWADSVERTKWHLAEWGLPT